MRPESLPFRRPVQATRFACGEPNRQSEVRILCRAFLEGYHLYRPRRTGGQAGAPGYGRGVTCTSETGRLAVRGGPDPSGAPGGGECHRAPPAQALHRPGRRVGAPVPALHPPRARPTVAGRRRDGHPRRRDRRLPLGSATPPCLEESVGRIAARRGARGGAGRRGLTIARVRVDAPRRLISRDRHEA